MRLLLRLLKFIVLFHLCTCQTKQSCSSPIYCQGNLLHVVQSAKVFNDSKTFVDMMMKHSVNETLRKFDALMLETEDAPSREKLQSFVADNFVSIGELDEAALPDFKSEPKIIKEIDDPVVRQFAKALHSIWPTLARKVSYHVHEYSERHSLIPVNHTFIIPGGRFKEFYYWDTYWIVKGLLLSDLFVTARGVLENLLSMVERFGFVPNGGRIYYLNRSQPPVLSLIMSDYVKVTKDFEFLKTYLPTLEKELHFWLERRTTSISKDGNTYRLAHYDSESDTPRPESYVEDVETCHSVPKKNVETIHECYTDLKAGAESGWDFSSRWLFAKDGSVSYNLHDISTRRNIPVDLNSFLYRCFLVMSRFYTIFQNVEKAKHWKEQANKWRDAIEKVLWNEEDGVWYDYDYKLNKHRRAFFASNLTPLWAGAQHGNQKSVIGGRCADYLHKERINTLRGGIPSSKFPSGQQWDYPNAWSPYQNMVIIGLHKSSNETAQELAKDLALNWVNSNVKAYHEQKAMFEKYNAAQAGQFGGGGEYHIQSGFGWSNGCVMELIHWYFRAQKRKYERW